MNILLNLLAFVACVEDLHLSSGFVQENRNKHLWA